jgi:hypothetical protein
MIMTMEDIAQVNDSDDYDPSWYDIEDTAGCWLCNGEGFVVTCFDDICNGLGYCIHGDGEEVCPECHGESSW